MDASLTPYVVVLFVSTGVAGTVSWYALVSADRNYRSSAFALGVLMALTAFGSLLQAARLLLGEQGTLFLYGVSNAATFVLPVVWLVFALVFAGYERLITRRTVAALLIVPFVAFATMVTNRWHGWFFEEIVVDVNVQRTPGWMYDVHLVYIYGLLLLGMVVLLHFAYTSHRLYRKQVVAILVAVAVPLVANVGYQLGFGPEMVNLTSVTFSMTNRA